MSNVKKLGVYAGTFSPFHVGHMNILLQAEKMFDKVIVATGVNPKKVGVAKEPLPESIRYVYDVFNYDGLLTDALKKIAVKYDIEPKDVVLVRGLRSEYDLNSEQNLRKYLKSMYPELRVVYFLCDGQYEHISSSDLRDMKAIAPDEYKKYVVQ